MTNPSPAGKDEAIGNDGSRQYENMVTGTLMWEKGVRFRRLCAQTGATVRMSAFRTTLPDPLPGEEYNVALAADILAGTIVPPGAVFSTNRAIGPRTAARGFREGPAYLGTQVVSVIGGGVCKISTTLYNVATLANFKIVERRAHGMPVPYVPPGQDATVSFGQVDFKFLNDTGHPVLIWADTRAYTLYMALYGAVTPPKVKWHHEILARRKSWNVYRNTSTLPPGKERVILKSEDGCTVRSWLTIESADGKVIRRDLGIDHYKPLPGIIERGVSR